MPIIHRNNDLRTCGAKTIASQTTVTAAGQPIAVVGDMEDHGHGDFVSNGRTVTIGGKSIIAVGDLANPDDLGHPNDDAATGLGTVTVG
jgi:uncharacterized Zn-binding protein involved in type VI secretion